MKTFKRKLDSIKRDKAIAKRVATFRSAREVFHEELSRSAEDRQLYLQIAIEDYEQDKDLPAFLLALRTIAITGGGVQNLATKTNLNRQTIYKALSPKGNPSFALIDTIINALGMQLSCKAL
jgi:probable addiction module antidote protein